MRPDIFLIDLQHIPAALRDDLVSEPEVENLYFHNGTPVAIVVLESETPQEWALRMRQDHGSKLIFSFLDKQIIR